MFKTQLYRFLIFLLGQLPLKAIRSIGSLLGLFAWLTRSRMWLVTKENIELCYPNLDPHRQLVLAKQSLRETGKTITETCFAWTQPTNKVLAKIQAVHGQHLIDQSRACNRGVVFIIPHQGNWEVINHFLGQQYALTHMFQPNRNPRLNHFIQAKRGITGTKFVPTDRSGIKAQLRALKTGQCIGVMPDQEPLVHTGCFANFFGIPALTNELVRGFKRTDSDFFIAVCERTEDGFEVKFDPVTADNENQDFLTIVNHGIEQAVRRHPEQYLWSYKRFRTRPEGELDYYQFDRHPLRTSLDSTLLLLYVACFRRMPATGVNLAAATLALLPIAKKRRKVTKVNLDLTTQPRSLSQPSFKHLLLSALEAPAIWHASPQQFTEMLANHEQTADERRTIATGSLILTPPLGSRETLMRYLSGLGQVTEYYHSNSVTSLDQMIRAKRTGMGIKLVEHDEYGRQYINHALLAGELATLCPDQQPRLRGGSFVPFFGHPALTTLAIPEFLRATGCQLYLGFATRCSNRFELHIEPIPVNPDETDEEILKTINDHLEAAISKFPAQYRWSDKRFNIQPLGQKKVYR